MSQFDSSSAYKDTDFSISPKDLEIHSNNYISDASNNNLVPYEEEVDLDRVFASISDLPEEKGDQYEWYEEYEQEYTIDENGNKWYRSGTGKWVKKRRKKKKKELTKRKTLVKKELTAPQLEMIEYIRENMHMEINEDYVYDIVYDEEYQEYTITTPFGIIETRRESPWYYIMPLDEYAGDKLELWDPFFQKISVNSKGIIVTTKDGNWFIDDSNKYKFIDTKGKSHLIPSEVIQILENNIGFIFPHDVSFDSNGNMIYENEIFSFNSEGDLVSYRNTEENISVYFDYNIEEYEKQGLYDIYNIESEYRHNVPEIGSSTKINFVATAYVNGHKYPFYSLGDQKEIDTTKAKYYAIMATRDFTRYTEEYLSAIDDYYFGTIIGDWDMSITDYSNSNVAAYTNVGYDAEKKNVFTFIPISYFDYMFHQFGEFYSEKALNLVVYHENAHLLEECLRREDKFPEEQVEEFYNKYKDLLPELEASVYKPIPNVNEFFAELVSNYYNAPEEMERYMPDAYEFIKQLCD